MLVRIYLKNYVNYYYFTAIYDFHLFSYVFPIKLCSILNHTTLVIWRVCQKIPTTPFEKPCSVTGKLATRPVEPARPEVAVPGVLEPLAWDACTSQSQVNKCDIGFDINGPIWSDYTGVGKCSLFGDLFHITKTNIWR